MSDCYTLQVVGKKLNQRGVTGITAVLLLGLMVMMAAFAIDIGHALVTRNELQNAADSAALSAGLQLGMNYLALSPVDQQDMSRNLTSQEQSQIITSGETASYANSAGQHNIAIAAGEVEFGTWDLNTKTFTPTVTRPNAIQVTARRDGTANGPIGTFFAGIFGINTMNVSATAVAALGTSGGPTPTGVANAPFGISGDWFSGVAQCGSEIKFYPTSTDGCAGWHNFDNPSHSASAIKSTIDGIADGTFVSPEIIPGVTQFNFSGGTIASAFPNLQALYNQEAVAGDWYVTVPVYEANGCANPSNMMTIVGYANVKVTAILGPPAKTIISEVQCDSFVNGAPPTGPGGVTGPGTPISPYPRLVS